MLGPGLSRSRQEPADKLGASEVLWHGLECSPNVQTPNNVATFTIFNKILVLCECIKRRPWQMLSFEMSNFRL